MPYITGNKAPGVWPSRLYDWTGEGPLHHPAFYVHVKANDPEHAADHTIDVGSPFRWATGPRIIEPALARVYAECAQAKPAIHSDSQILRGKPCLAGTRIPVALVLRYLATGEDPAEDLDLSAKDVSDCLEYAAMVCDYALHSGG